MDITGLIPTPDKIPAPAWAFILLEQVAFLAHIIVVNALVGGALIALYYRFTGTDRRNTDEMTRPVLAKLPTLLALGINFGVVPLLFLQVVYGRLFYTSSILMAVYWISIIPVLIAAYYAAHLQFERFKSTSFSRIALSVCALLLLYTAFVLISNNSLMERPETWGGYFENRGGLLLNLSLSVFIPRFLHFLFASLAIGGLFFAVVYAFGKNRDDENAKKQIKAFLKIFATFSAAQATAGLWYLMAMPKDFMLNFMGRDLFSAIALMTGVACGLGAITTGFLGRLSGTLVFLSITFISMITARHQLRMMYLADHFRISDLQVAPQYSVFILFLFVLVIGLAAVGYMVKVGILSFEGRRKS